MQEGQLLMTQADRDRLVTLKKAKKKLITQRVAAEELGLSTRQVKRLLYGLKKRGDKAVIHGLRGKPSKRRIEEAIEREAVKIREFTMRFCRRLLSFAERFKNARALEMRLFRHGGIYRSDVSSHLINLVPGSRFTVGSGPGYRTRRKNT